ncbi:MAG: threonine synthase [Nocardioidaceae bacterium]|nr:threonine synthase [Nocardioidaceae bacterium]
MTPRAAPSWRGVIAEYGDRLPAIAQANRVTLGEGGTPLVRSRWLSGLTGCEVWLKVEAANPTGSFKDRGMTVVVSHSLEQGAAAVVCASTGNTSASMAAYAARAGLTPVVLVPDGGIARGKMAQAVMHGARIVSLRTGFDGCLELARELAASYPVTLVNSVNPLRLEGQKTAAFEIVDTLGRAPDVHVLPVGNAGNIASYWKGFREYVDAGRCTSTPALWGFQAAGAAPLVSGTAVASPQTAASAIRIGNPASWHLAEAARDESGGLIAAVSDQEILSAQQQLAAVDGVFVEPASAAGAAGLVARHGNGVVEPEMTITVTLTGHGLKDIETALKFRGDLVDVVVDPELAQVAEAAGLDRG